MSGQDINPFADPNEVNPFANPPTANAENDFSNDFNPFAVQHSNAPSQQSSPPSTNTTSSPVSPSTQQPQYNQPSSPATLETTSSKKQTPVFKSYGSTGDEALKDRIEELERKEADLERAEAELNKKQLLFEKRNNFPPLPKCCCVGPCFFHDISIEIPIEHQRMCRMVFYSWQLYILTICFNLISALAGLCVGADDGAILFGVSILYFVLFPMLSFVCWYRPLYKALKTDSSFNYFMFFFVFGFQTVMTFIYALGINSLGTCGWINAAQLASSKKNHAVSAMYFVTAALYTVLVLIDVYLIRRVHRVFRSSGATLQKAQQEFAKGVVSNKSVQQAAADADPSVAAQTSHNAQGDEYNPFGGQQATKSVPPPYTPATIEPETAPTYQSKPFGGAAAAVSQDDSMRQRQEELERKAAELDRKEQELKRQQHNLPKENNFPPFPKFFPCGPCYYHDISAEIPIQSQRTCKLWFYIWQLYSFALIFNFISALAYLVDGGDNAASTFGVSIIYAVLFPPLSFIVWYRPLYKALRSDSSFNYFLFFFMMFFQILFNILYAIGLPGFGTCGWINGASHADKGHIAVAAMMFVCASLFTLMIILKIFLFRKLHTFYRASGASLQKAQTEFATGVASNKDVQNAAAAAVKAGVSANNP